MKEKEADRLKIIASGRCFFPAGAFLWSTKEQAKVAKEAGYEGMEFLPTWRVVWETVRHGRLLADERMVASFHRDWRFDRVMEAKRRGLPTMALQFRERADLLFPPSSVCAKALIKLQTVYGRTVSTQWREDTEKFRPVMVELWGKPQGWNNYSEILTWLRKDPDNHQLILDTAKLTGWLKDFGLERKKKKVVEELLPFAHEVHYRFKGKIKRGVKLGPALADDSTENLRFLITEMGFSGPVVVELGWPDIKEPILGWGKDFSQFLEVHQGIVKFLKNL